LHVLNFTQVGERHRTGNGIGLRIAGLTNALDNHRRGDVHRDGCRDHTAVTIIDRRRIRQRQRLAFVHKSESAGGDIVRPR